MYASLPPDFRPVAPTDLVGLPEKNDRRVMVPLPLYAIFWMSAGGNREVANAELLNALWLYVQGKLTGAPTGNFLAPQAVPIEEEETYTPAPEGWLI